MPSILLAENLAFYVNGAVKLTSSFTTLVDAIIFLKKTYPALHQSLFDENGQVRDSVNFYLNSQPVTEHLHEPIPMHELDCLEIVTTIDDI